MPMESAMVVGRPYCLTTEAQVAVNERNIAAMGTKSLKVIY
jgi:hypothetical protein